MALLDESLFRDLAHKGDLLAAPNGDIQTISGLNNIKEALFRRLVTQPGSLVHRPNYGVGIKDFKNAPNSLPNQQRLALRVKEQFELDARVTEVVGLKVTVDDDTPEKIIIFVRINIEGFGETEMDFIPFGEVI